MGIDGKAFVRDEAGETSEWVILAAAAVIAALGLVASFQPQLAKAASGVSSQISSAQDVARLPSGRERSVSVPVAVHQGGSTICEVTPTAAACHQP